MGCGCGKNRNKRRQSSRMPIDTPPKKIRDILVPINMTPDERRSTIVKIQNRRKAEERRRVADLVDKKMNIGN